MNRYAIMRGETPPPINTIQKDTPCSICGEHDCGHLRYRQGERKFQSPGVFINSTYTTYNPRNILSRQDMLSNLEPMIRQGMITVEQALRMLAQGGVTVEQALRMLAQGGEVMDTNHVSDNLEHGRLYEMEERRFTDLSVSGSTDLNQVNITGQTNIERDTIIRRDLTVVGNVYVNGVASGQDPIANADLTNKRYVDTAIQISTSNLIEELGRLRAEIEELKNKQGNKTENDEGMPKM
jgi:hypothetical protein